MSNFTKTLLNWYRVHQRNLPWRETSNPYNIWLSEVILQQTRVTQGLPYYLKFITKYPTVFDLARADEEEILKLWQGLGYYSRARNLHQAAKMVVELDKGVFPTSYKDLKKLKGVGDYTASAIASICYQEPVAVLDGNVFRVLSRFLGIDTPINTTVGKKIFKEKANSFLDHNNPGEYNQAIMEFGALHCKPKSPFCKSCPLQQECVAYQQGRVGDLPVKLKKTKVRDRFFNYLVFISKTEQTVLRKRNTKGIWRNLYEFPVIESETNLTKKELVETKGWREFDLKKECIEVYNNTPMKHVLSHQRLWIKFWFVEVDSIRDHIKTQEDRLIDYQEIHDFPVPVIIEKFLENIELVN